MAETNKPCCTASRPVTAGLPATGVERNATASTEGMVKIAAGSFLMGTDGNEGFPADGEGPAREVFVGDYYIGVTTVTNAEFSAFVEATGYITDAEKYGWSFVFEGLLSEETLNDPEIQVAAGTPWWCMVAGAYWACPEGPESSIADRMDHPVVHVSWNDAVNYCNRIGKRLPTEAEWEKAARGGLVQKQFPWGDELTPEGKHQCNIWQGTFPDHNTLDDGCLGTAPAKSFEPNGYGLYNTSGNVWEWCADWFTPGYHLTTSVKDPAGPNSGQTRTMKGGSFMCHESYCNRYRVAARSSNTPDTSASNVGFRCVVNC